MPIVKPTVFTEFTHYSLLIIVNKIVSLFRPPGTNRSRACFAVALFEFLATATGTGFVAAYFCLSGGRGKPDWNNRLGSCVRVFQWDPCSQSPCSIVDHLALGVVQKYPFMEFICFVGKELINLGFSSEIGVDQLICVGFSNLWA
jgi:hypothetical protein